MSTDLTLGCLPAALIFGVGIVLIVLGTINLNRFAKPSQPNQFQQVHTEFSQLKAQFDAQTLSEERFKARLQELMITDQQGRWWIIGYETGLWYVHDGQNWVPGQPEAASAQVATQTDAQKKEVAKARSMRLIGLILLAVALVWACVVSGLVAYLSSY